MTDWRPTHLDRRPSSIVEVATESLGLYVAPPVSHLELAARLPGYAVADLERLMDERQLVGLRCLRGSAFLMPVDLLPLIVPATRAGNVKAFGGYLRKHLKTAPYEEWVLRVEAILAPGEALTKSEIVERLDPPEDDLPLMSNMVSQMATESRLIGVRVPVSWRSARVAYTRWHDWLPGVDVHSPDPTECQTELAVLYLRSFGPASPDDFSWWSGLTKTEAKRAFAAAGAEPSGALFDIVGRSDESITGVRFLPIWDTLFVTWKDRSRFLPDDLLPYVYDSLGNATSVVLVDGMVAGVWAMSTTDDPLEIRVAPFGRLSKAQWNRVEEEAQVLGGLAGTSELSVIQVGDPPNLRQGRRNLFMRPV